MLTVFLVILGLFLLTLTPTFIEGFMEGFRGHKPSPPSPEESKTECKPSRKLRVIWPPEEEESKR